MSTGSDLRDRAVAPPDDVTAGFLEVLREVTGHDEVGRGDHFFETLGADSMVMARFCARVRRRPGLPAVAMQDVYEHPTAGALAAATATPVSAVPSAPAPAVEDPARSWSRVGSPVLCGALQLVVFLAYTYVVAVLVTEGYAWLDASGDLGELYLRAVLLGAGGFVGLVLLPIVAKWLLVGRFTEAEIPVWTLRYVRFWTVKVLIRANPAVLLVGSPLYSWYLRALGARIGAGSVILTQHVPVCTDLLTVGRRTVVRKDVLLSCYRVESGILRPGRVTLGDDVYVGETVVLDTDTVMGDRAVIGHTSALHPGQVVPADGRVHGSPARETTTDYRVVPPCRTGPLRPVLYSVVQLLLLVAVALPVSTGIGVALLRTVPWLAALLDPPARAFLTSAFYLETLALAAVVVLGSLLALLLAGVLAGRLLTLPLRPGRVYPLLGPHYWLHRTVTTVTNLEPLTRLFGDSSAIPHYLRALGYRLRPMAQTGSNFGMAVRHESPVTSAVGVGTVVADDLSMIGADYSASSFALAPARIGAHNFLGNRIAYPAQGRTGDNCLLATKVMVPVDGPLREGVGLLGSPSFEIPRTVARDADLAWGTPLDRRRALVRKNRHNAVSMLWRLAAQVGFTTGTLLAVAGVAALPIAVGALEITVVEIAVLLWLVGWNALVHRAVGPLQARAPEGLSIYAPRFWRHERYWKVPDPTFVMLFNGTPYKTFVWRLLGARVGRRVFDDGALLTERSFTTIGDDVTLNEGTVLQCHSQEDGAFKSDHIRLDDRVTLGVGAFLHYGTVLGADARLATDSFLMKGGEVPPGDRWGGNPARPDPGAVSTAASRSEATAGAR